MSVCSECGAPMEEGVLDGFCPACLERFIVNEEEPKRIGRYKILHKIGEGGCGVVYMAEQQEPIKRLVALKVIKPGMDTRWDGTAG